MTKLAMSKQLWLCTMLIHKYNVLVVEKRFIYDSRTALMKVSQLWNKFMLKSERIYLFGLFTFAKPPDNSTDSFGK